MQDADPTFQLTGDPADDQMENPNENPSPFEDPIFKSDEVKLDLCLYLLCSIQVFALGEGECVEK